MANGYTVFTSYVLVPTSGFSQAIHCNYIKSIQLNTNNPNIEEIKISFSNINDFRFLNNGYTINKIYALIQLVSGITSGTTIIKPDAANWKKIDISNQVIGYVSGHTLTAAQLTGVVFKVPLNVYNTYSKYDLNYLNYPSALPADDNKLCFGDEIYFLGNVTTDIHADVYVTDLSITLGQNQFNSSTNSTWLQIPLSSRPQVAITEIGIYDANKN